MDADIRVYCDTQCFSIKDHIRGKYLQMSLFTLLTLVPFDCIDFLISCQTSPLPEGQIKWYN